MVVRKQQRDRKYFGTRRWGVGNIKNARGKGSRGGVGNANARKNKFTRMVVETPWLIKKKGFTKWRQNKLTMITLEQINRMVETGKIKDSVDLPHYKVLSNGTLNTGVKVKAQAFSKKATEKIKNAGGEALLIKKE